MKLAVAIALIITLGLPLITVLNLVPEASAPPTLVQIEVFVDMNFNVQVVPNPAIVVVGVTQVVWHFATNLYTAPPNTGPWTMARAERPASWGIFSFDTGYLNLIPGGQTSSTQGPWNIPNGQYKYNIWNQGSTPYFDPYIQIVSSVGGTASPVDKFGLLAPYFGLASTIIAATCAAAFYAKRAKHTKEKE